MQQKKRKVMNRLSEEKKLEIAAIFKELNEDVTETAAICDVARATVVKYKYYQGADKQPPMRRRRRRIAPQIVAAPATISLPAMKASSKGRAEAMKTFLQSLAQLLT